MHDATRVFAGRCTITYEADSTSEREGDVLVLVKPDNTVLVHDAEGYRPAGWLTRADSLRVARRNDDHLDLLARSGSEVLRVTGESVVAAEYPITPAGKSVGQCPDCGDELVRTGGGVACLGCGDDYRLPRDASVTENTCSSCGLPTIEVERGTSFEVCLDRECASIDDAVRERFEGEWTCPDCGSALVVERERTLGASCPACDTHYPIPTGVVDGTCDCGLPRFDTPRGTRCLDARCTATAGLD